ncbi:PilW family protein [Sphaerotilus sp.]|uniref:PilW family protein n=1 Tax=Sphaerotilus sp. TaxID=2093942 RepID=UPI002ACD7132|nr:PilW family protein [Sphaerotilus sp.]MDZ7856160.1 PilW family protein [Sphaerotilus sp.]
MKPARGITLIEVMVSLVVSAFISIVVVGVMSMVETSKRRTISGSDLGQVAAYVQAVLDRALRNAGSGFTQAAAHAFGCQLHAARSGTQVLPRTSANPLPAPFASVNTGTTGVFRLAPVVIANGQTTPGISGQPSDVLIVMSGQSGQSETAMSFAADAQLGTLLLQNSVGLAPNDLLLVTDRQPISSGMAPCLFEQVASSFNPATAGGTVALTGTYAANSVDTAVLTDYSIVSQVLNLGNVANGNPPSLQLVGVGDDNTLYSYDLLQTSGAPLQPMGDGVFELQALYGLDTNGDRRIDQWAAPTGDYAVASLMDGSAAANTRLRTIVAVRIGLLLRTLMQEGSAVAPASLRLFTELGDDLTYTRTLSTAEQRYRYRTLESTVPLRNLLLTP